MRKLLFLVVMLLVAGGGGYYYWQSSRAMVSIEEEEHILRRDNLLVRCAALHRQIDDTMKAEGKSEVLRAGSKVLAEVFIVAAHYERDIPFNITQRNFDPDMLEEIADLQSRYAPYVRGYVQRANRDQAALVEADVNHCADLRNMLN